MTDQGAPRAFVPFFLLLAAWTAMFAVALWRDPHAANDSGLLLAKSTYADGHQYVPDLFIRHWADAAPGLWARIAAWVGAIGAIAWWTSRASHARRRTSPLATLAVGAVVVLCVAFALERWPGRRVAPSFGDALAVPGDATHPAPLVFVSGAARLRYDEAVLGPGTVDLVSRSAVPISSLTVTVGGQGSVLEVGGRPPLVLRPTGALVAVPFVPDHEVRGRDGRSVAFTRARLAVAGEAVLRLGQAPVDAAAASPPTDTEMEPEDRPDR